MISAWSRGLLIVCWSCTPVGSFESAASAVIFRRARHPYTAELLQCMPTLLGARLSRLPTLAGQPPRPGETLIGCAFAPRCPRAAALWPCRAAAVDRGAGCQRGLPLSARRMTTPALKVSNLRVQFGAHAAVANASFEVWPGENAGAWWASRVLENRVWHGPLCACCLRRRAEWNGAARISWTAAAPSCELCAGICKSFSKIRWRVWTRACVLVATVGEPLEIFEPGLSRLQRRSRVEKHARTGRSRS